MTASRLPRRSKAAAASTNRVVRLVKDQIVSSYKTILHHFNIQDTAHTGKVGQKTLLEVLERCNIPMTGGQANEIFQLLDSDDEGRILYKDFLAIFNMQMPRMDGDNPSTSKQPASAGLPVLSRSRIPTALTTAKSEGWRPQTKTSKDLMALNLRDRPNTSMRSSLVYGGNISATRIAVIAQMNEFVRDNRAKLEGMFEMSDLDSQARVSKFETVRIFHAAGFHINIEEIDDVLDVLSERGSKGFVNYKSLLKKLESLTFDMPEIFESLTSVQFAPTHLCQVVAVRFRDSYDRLLTCLSEEDTEGTGMVGKGAVLRILKGISLEMSEQALDEVIRASGLPNSTYVNLHLLIQRFVPNHRPPSMGRYAELAERARVPKEIHNAPSMNSDQLLQALKEKMEDHIKYPREMFLKLDTDKDGTLTKQELAKAFLCFNLYPKEADVDALFQTVDVHQKGRIGYAEFLSMLVPRGDNKQSLPHHDSFKSYMRRGSFYSLVPHGVAPIRLSTQGKLTPVGKLSVTDIQQVMKKKLGSRVGSLNLKALLLQRDPDDTGFVSKEMVLQVLRKLDVFITLPQLQEVLVVQGVASHGENVEMHEFLDKFLRTRGQAISGNNRLGSQTHRPMTHAPSRVDKSELLDRIRAKLKGRWDDVQQAFFEEQDQALDFKVGREEVARILSLFGVPITQDQGKLLFEDIGVSMDYSDFVRLLDFGGSRRPTAAPGASPGQRLGTGCATSRGAQVEVISPSRRGTGKTF